MENNSPASRGDLEAYEDERLDELEGIDIETLKGCTEWITYTYLMQELRAVNALRICRMELWNVNQMGGWHSGYGQIARLQPVGTAELREQSLARWSKMSTYIDQETENLNHGLKLGYSAPKSVVQRIIDQIDGILSLELEKSPFYSPAIRDPDEQFAAATGQIVTDQIYPAFQRYRDYLADTYIKNARSVL